MNPKTATYIGIVVGGTIGGYVPLLWGAGTFSFSSIFFGGVGSIVGIWITFKMTH